MSSVKGLTAEQEEELTEAFNLFDRDGKGKIASKELGTVLHSLGQAPSEVEMQELVTIVDPEGTGYVKLRPFLAMMSDQMNDGDTEADLKKLVFQQFDKNGDGRISAAELRFVMSSLGENLTDEEVNAMVAAADKTGDGFVNFEEFSNMVGS